MTGIFNGIKELIANFKAIITAFQMVINFIVTVVKSLGQLVRLLVKIVTNVDILLGTLPVWLVAFGTVTVGASILYLIIGRETGK